MNETGKVWEFMLDGMNTFVPRHLSIFSAPTPTRKFRLHWQEGRWYKPAIWRRNTWQAVRLVKVLPEIQQEKWQLYLYRPYQTITPKRVMKVFEVLEGVLRKHLGQDLC